MIKIYDAIMLECMFQQWLTAMGCHSNSHYRSGHRVIRDIFTGSLRRAICNG